MRELHWHPNTDERQYYIEGQARTPRHEGLRFKMLQRYKFTGM
jgi:uncharacterized protein (UPF0248 family)